MKQGTSYRKIVFILMIVLLCFPVVMASDYSGYINAYSLDPYFSGGVGGNLVGVGTKTNSSVPWWTDFDSTGTPEYYIMYDSADQYLRGSTTFTINDTAGVFATGSVQMLNGTFGYSGARIRHQYYYLQFNTWTPGSRSGILSGLLKFPAGEVAAIPGSLLVQGAFVGTTWTDNTGNATMGGGSSGGKTVMSGGAIAYGLPATSSVSYDVTYTSGYGDAALSNLVYTKAPDNDLASNMQIRSASGALLQSSGFTAKTDGANWNLIGNNYYLSMYVPSLTPYYYNSSLFTFTAVPPTPTPTPTPTPAPTSTAIPTPTPAPTPVGGVRATFDVDIRDSISHALIQNCMVGIKNTTSGIWRNSTNANGAVYFDSTGTAYNDALQVGQTNIIISANKTGYYGTILNSPDAWKTVSLNSQSSTPHGQLETLYLTQIGGGGVPPAGNWTWIINVKSNLYNQPIVGEMVTTTMGSYSRSLYTDANGIVTFTGLPDAFYAYASVPAVQGYQSGTISRVPVLNTIQTDTITLIKIGGTYVTTPIPTTSAPTTVSTWVGPIETSGPNIGQPITDPTAKGLAIFYLLIDAGYTIMQMAIWVIMFWLLWSIIYTITGGKILDKIIKRGRR